MPAEVEAVNTGLLLYMPYRAMENKVFAAVAAAGFEDLTLARDGSSNASALLASD